MAHLRVLIITIFLLYTSVQVISKIILPHKLRYLENMLNAEVLAKAAKIRRRMEANPNIQENDTDWPMLLAKYQEEKKKLDSQQLSYSHNGLYKRRLPNL